MYLFLSDAFLMSKSALHAFIDRARADDVFRAKLEHLDPNQIIEFAAQQGFIFSPEIKGRFINQMERRLFLPTGYRSGSIMSRFSSRRL